MCRVICICNQKGGVAKTTSTVNLGVGLAMEGNRVLLIDDDPQGSLTASLGYVEPDDIRRYENTLNYISSITDAAIAEADKIELRIKDLQYADEALSKEMDKLQSQREALVREQQQVQAAIRGELRPQVEALRDKLAIFTAALEKAKAKEMLKHFTEVLNEQLLRIKNEDEFSNDFDVREKIREVLQEPLERLLTEILEKCNYDNYVGSRFDEDMCDVVVNGSEKLSQGQGFRAFLNSVMALAVQEMLNEFNMHMPHLLVMDSPILSLKEREEDKGTEITSDSMRGGLFQYMIEHEKNRQTIILENEIPTLDYSTANIIHFTRKIGDGRFGLIEGYRD